MLFPHMHLRGKSFRFEVVSPEGEREILLDVPRYDFNWQLRYDLAEPKPIKKGAEIVCTAHFDNSKENPANPDPSKVVGWGPQTWDEMMIGFFATIPTDGDPDPLRLKRRGADFRMTKTRPMGSNKSRGLSSSLRNKARLPVSKSIRDPQ